MIFMNNFPENALDKESTPNHELPNLYFAMDMLDRTGYDLLSIKNFVHFNSKSGVYEDFKTMFVSGMRFIVAYSDIEQTKKGPPTSHRNMTPEEYLPIIISMPFDSIIVNPFDNNARKAIQKSILETANALQIKHQPQAEEVDSATRAMQIERTIKTEFNEQIASTENSIQLMTNEELLAIFTDFFAPNTEFFSYPNSPKYKAYFDTINAAIIEMVKNPMIYKKATRREQCELIDMLNNRIAGYTNRIICALIFCMGRYAVIPSSILCVDFVEAIPCCIALYLLLTAQLLPAEKRKQLIDAGDDTNKQPLTDAMNVLSVCDANWKFMIL